MRHNPHSDGFATPAEQGPERGLVASLVAGVVLALGTIVAATAVTVGIARASAADSIIDHEGSLFAIALLLGLLFIGISSITLFPPRNQKHRH